MGSPTDCAKQDPARRRVFCCHEPGADGRKSDSEEKLACKRV